MALPRRCPEDRLPVIAEAVRLVKVDSSERRGSPDPCRQLPAPGRRHVRFFSRVVVGPDQPADVDRRGSPRPSRPARGSCAHGFDDTRCGPPTCAVLVSVAGLSAPGMAWPAKIVVTRLPWERRGRGRSGSDDRVNRASRPREACRSRRRCLVARKASVSYAPCMCAGSPRSGRAGRATVRPAWFQSTSQPGSGR